MLNKSMERLLKNNECFAVDEIGIFVNIGDEYGQTYKIPNDDYLGYDLCVKETETWIQSVGKRLTDGHLFASTTNNFYQNPEFECVWLR